MKLKYLSDKRTANSRAADKNSKSPIARSSIKPENTRASLPNFR